MTLALRLYIFLLAVGIQEAHQSRARAVLLSLIFPECLTVHFTMAQYVTLPLLHSLVSMLMTLHSLVRDMSKVPIMLQMFLLPPPCNLTVDFVIFFGCYTKLTLRFSRYSYLRLLHIGGKCD